MLLWVPSGILFLACLLYWPYLLYKLPTQGRYWTWKLIVKTFLSLLLAIISIMDLTHVIAEYGGAGTWTVAQLQSPVVSIIIMVCCMVFFNYLMN